MIANPMGTPRKQVFLSYARKDLEHARRLYEDLSTDPKVHVWFDQRDLLPGIKWRPAIRMAIRESKSFIALFSKQSTGAAGYRNTELSQALEVVTDFPDDQIFLIPVKLEECDVPHEAVQAFHFACLYPDWDLGVEQIRRAAGISPVNRVSERKRKVAKRKSTRLETPTHPYRIKVVKLNVDVPGLGKVLTGLNTVQTVFHFSALAAKPTPRALTAEPGGPQLDIDRLSKAFYRQFAPPEMDHAICVTDRFIAFDEDDYHYSNYLGLVGPDADERISFASIRGLQEHATRARVPFERALAYGIVSDVTAYFLDLKYHHALRGCPMDSTEDHTDLVKGLKARRFCKPCSRRLATNPALHHAVVAMLKWTPTKR